MTWTCADDGCREKPTHRLRLIAEATGEVLELDFCTPHAAAMQMTIESEVPGAKSHCAGTIRVDSDGNQINMGMVQ